MEYFYCKSWFRAKKAPIEPWTAELARSAHEEHRFYTVLVGSPARPSAFIELTRNAISVGFLDEILRETLSYSFRTVSGGKVFLSMATYREFIDGSDAVKSGSTYMFSEEGSVSITNQTYSPATTATADGAVDVSANYSPYPIFGDYQDVIRVERL